MVSSGCSREEGLVIAPGQEGALSGLGELQPFLVSAVGELESTLEKRAIADFNKWLVCLRILGMRLGHFRSAGCLTSCVGWQISL